MLDLKRKQRFNQVLEMQEAARIIGAVVSNQMLAQERPHARGEALWHHSFG
jgi:hypothetical protein